MKDEFKIKDPYQVEIRYILTLLNQMSCVDGNDEEDCENFKQQSEQRINRLRQFMRNRNSDEEPNFDTPMGHQNAPKQIDEMTTETLELFIKHCALDLIEKYVKVSEQQEVEKGEASLRKIAKVQHASKSEEPISFEATLKEDQEVFLKLKRS